MIPWTTTIPVFIWGVLTGVWLATNWPPVDGRGDAVCYDDGGGRERTR